MGDDHLRALGRLHAEVGLGPLMDHQLYRLGYEEGEAIRNGTSSHDDIVEGYDSGSNSVKEES